MKKPMLIALIALFSWGIGTQASAQDKLLPQPLLGDWPWWRGPDRNGISADREAVTKWSPKENVVWAANVPARTMRGASEGR